jgi:hypothetical protein
MLIFRIIDWDYVIPVPTRLSATSLNHRMFDVLPDDAKEIWSLNATQDGLFPSNLAKIEQERSSNNLSLLYLDSRENLFMSHVLLFKGRTLPLLQKYHTAFVKQALTRTSDTLARAAHEWDEFTNDFFRKQGRPVPDWPLYVKVQEELGRYGKTQYHRYGRMMKKKVQEELKMIFEDIHLQFPEWKWAARNHCYLTAGLCSRYKLPSGKYSCRL